MKQIVAAGVAQCGSVYPNAQRTLAILRQAGIATVIDNAFWLPPNTQLWQVAQGPFFSRVRMTAKLLLGGLGQALKAIRYSRETTLVYAPYPSLFVLWWLSWTPRRLRPFLVADAYISIWDAMFRDRDRSRERSMLSRIVRAVEARAMRTADRILVDTEANTRELTSLYDLREDHIRSLPLAIDESYFLTIPPRNADAGKRIRITFVGTMIPLHGIEVVLEAMRLLNSDDRLEFRLVGDGQLAPFVEGKLREYALERVTWLRGYHGLDVLADEISAADICLGVFGGSGKAARVLPFKLYLYFAAGRPVISQAQLSTPSTTPYPPIERVDEAKAIPLASAIMKLVENPGHRAELARASRAYYREWLSNASLLRAWKCLLDSSAD